MQQTITSVGAGNDPERFWDPVTSGLVKDKMEECEYSRRHLLERFEYEKKYAKRNVAILMFSLMVLIVWNVESAITSPQGDAPSLSAFCLLIFLMIAAVYRRSVRKYEKTLIYMEIAKEYGWLYDAETAPDKWQRLETVYPEIFRKGGKDQSVGNQFWGTFEREPFWSACFRFGDDGGKNSRMRTETVYAFRLPCEAAHEFVLTGQDFMTKAETRHELGLTTESNDFNALFHIDYRGDTGSVGADILQVLSPDAQEKLIAFRQAVGPFDLLFRGSCMVVSFAGEMKMRFTNFSGKFVIDPRDKEMISTRMESIISLAHAVLPCIE